MVGRGGAAAIGEDTAVAFAGSQSNFELNAMRAVIVNDLLHSATILADGCEMFRKHPVEGTALDEERIAAHVGNTLMLVTALSPVIGCRAARIAEAALRSGAVTRKPSTGCATRAGWWGAGWAGPERGGSIGKNRATGTRIRRCAISLVMENGAMACEVLVLDDDPLVLMTMVELLHDEGFNVEKASSVTEALQMLDAELPQILVTDLNLGEQRTGLDVAQELRRKAPNLGVIFVTGRPDLVDHRHLGWRQLLLRKPFEPRKLAEMVWKLQEGG